jgi:hypothetical protein
MGPNFDEILQQKPLNTTTKYSLEGMENWFSAALMPSWNHNWEIEPAAVKISIYLFPWL